MSVKLATTLSPRPWGVDTLPAPFVSPPGERIGEVWFTPPPALDTLLVKYLFTGAALSVQVHPADAQAPAGSRGKEECWYVTAAEPGAKLGIGFIRALDEAQLRAAALDGSIEQLLDWHKVKAGDFFYIPAGTVHAIGAGVSLIEVQQNSDITYRLYDYGRPRELHLDAGIKVAQGAPYPGALHRHVAASGSETLVEGPHFRLDRLDGAPGAATAARYRGPVLVLPLDVPLAVNGETVLPGDCALAESIGAVAFGPGLSLITQPLG
ncbi:class I mannose-6-phosphate isomerase [Novosphingobium sp.]|uniref:class I mannose-6-phosphate isomerase n=1 Tax=Novosphingobium sp. TaxID=1874826 RepID=UPI00286BCE34|nr:class I mannose-6-phosphate isomerase [Novosphingobium sp.]